MIGHSLSLSKHNTETQIENYSGERLVLRRMWNRKPSAKPNGLTSFKRVNYNNNPNFVYDNSDYTRFLKQRALNRTYKK
jgi:hypothetical protein|uniref:Uncharacterized protein n=1 Tax=viral metagenome TaxID=1070528 RepID=A0A6C0IMK5_9ZZZZ